MNRITFLLMLVLAGVFAGFGCQTTVKEVIGKEIPTMRRLSSGGQILLADAKRNVILDKQGYGNIPEKLAPRFCLAPLLVSAAIDSGVVTRQTKINCGNGVLTIGDLEYRDPEVHSQLSVEDVLRKRSCVGSFQIARMLAIKKNVGHELNTKQFAELSLGRIPVTMEEFIVLWERMLTRNPEAVGTVTDVFKTGHGVAVSSVLPDAKTNYAFCIGYFPVKEPRFILIVIEQKNGLQPDQADKEILDRWDSIARKLQ